MQEKAIITIQNANSNHQILRNLFWHKLRSSCRYFIFQSTIKDYKSDYLESSK